jgi:hypothetical protein
MRSMRNITSRYLVNCAQNQVQITVKKSQTMRDSAGWWMAKLEKCEGLNADQS